jgi:hypothetical protein
MSSTVVTRALEELRTRKIKTISWCDRLLVLFPKDATADDLRAVLRDNKAELHALIELTPPADDLPADLHFLWDEMSAELETCGIGRERAEAIALARIVALLTHGKGDGKPTSKTGAA